MRALRVRRHLVIVAVSVTTVTVGLAAAPVVDAATRSKGQLFVFDSDDCTGGGNAAKVTVPASVGGRDYPPNIDLDLYATDTATGERFGPFVAHTNNNGDFCERVTTARATKWKIELIEPGSGFTDSKVVTVLGSSPPATTTPPITTTPAPTAPPTTGATTTTTGATTTMSAVTTTDAPSTTIAATTTTVVDSGGGPPIEIVPTPVPPEWSLPATGAPSSDLAVWALWLTVMGGVLVAVVRRRRVAPGR